MKLNTTQKTVVDANVAHKRPADDAQHTVVAVKADDIPSRCTAPESPVTLAALKLYFALDSIARNLPERTSPVAKIVTEALNEGHLALYGNARDS